MENSTRFWVRHMVWSREDTKVGDREEMISLKTAAETLNTEIKKGAVDSLMHTLQISNMFLMYQCLKSHI